MVRDPSAPETRRRTRSGVLRFNDHTMSVLPDGGVLVIGGRDMHSRGDRAIGSIEAWRPCEV
jgi:hypothetical protein